MTISDIDDRKDKSSAIFQTAMCKVLPQMHHQFVATEDIIKIERRYNELHAEAVAEKDVWRELQAVANQWGLAVLMADAELQAEAPSAEEPSVAACVKAEPCQIIFL